jgi:hypothetical protein
VKILQRIALQGSWISLKVSNYLLRLSANTGESGATLNKFNWQTVKKTLVVIAAFAAVYQAFLPDGTPGSPRSLVLGLGLASAAAAAAI